MENKNHNGFGNGFLLGLIIGVIATLLLTTKRGREILREFTEKGLDKVSDIEKKIEKTASEKLSDLEEFDDEEEYVAPVTEKPKEVRQSEQSNNGNVSAKPSRSHRFFRTSKRN